MITEIHCVGTPHGIGFSHGSGAKQQVHGSVKFYKKIFLESTTLDWEAVKREAAQYIEPLESKCPRYLDEIRGLAEGAGLEFLDVVALNVRTEIIFGMFANTSKKVEAQSDGCTSLAWLKDGQSFLSQNWDWKIDQGPNVVVCHVSQPGTDIPDFSMVTEAGIIGKIGLNAKGVGCCLNAIRARGVDRTRLPTHLALRTVLESSSRKEAVGRLEAIGVAASAHIIIGDKTGSVGMECSHIGIKELEMDGKGRVLHTNHLCLPHPGVDEPPYWKDSQLRLDRIRELSDAVSRSSATLDSDVILSMLKDEQGLPGSINRLQTLESDSQTIFTIIMDLTQARAKVTFGRPTEVTAAIVLQF